MRSPLRTCLTVTSTAIAFVLLGLLKGYVDGFDAMVAAMDNRHIEVINRTLRYYPLPLAHGSVIGDFDGVLGVSPLSGFSGYYQAPRNRISVQALDSELLRTRADTAITLSPRAMTGFEESRAAIIVGEDLVAEYGFQPGAQLPLIGPPRDDGSTSWTFTVVGTWSSRAGLPSQFAYVRFDHVDQARQHAKGMVWSLHVRVAEEGANAATARAIDDTFYANAYPTRSISARESARAPLARMGNVEYFVYAVVGASMFAILFVTAGAMAQSVQQRKSELAVLMSIGFRKLTLCGIVLLEATAMCLAAACIGMVVAAFLLPNLPMNDNDVTIPPAVYLAAGSLALLVAFVSVVVPCHYIFRASEARTLGRRGS